MNGLTVEQYLAWKEEGLKDSAILEKLHYSPNSQMLLMKWKKENGIGQSRKTSKKYAPKIADSISLERVKELRGKGYTVKQIAQALGIDYNYLSSNYLPAQFRNGNLEKKRIGG